MQLRGVGTNGKSGKFPQDSLGPGSGFSSRIVGQAPRLDTRAEPRAVFDAVWRVIVRKYGQYGQGGGRAQQQARSVKVLFPDRDRISGGNFSVDAVPAVRRGDLWAIPTKDQNRWVEGEGRWVTTGAVLFGELSTDLNQSVSTPRVGDRPAYKPIVKLVRQVRETHLGDKRPGGLYLEFVTFEAWRSGHGHRPAEY